MKERPILMCGDMVRATLADLKSQTRRPFNPQPSKLDAPWPKPESCVTFMDIHGAPEYYAKCGYCPYGGVGDRLWVKETFRLVNDPATCVGTALDIDYRADKKERIDDRYKLGKMPWRPSIFMRRCWSRIMLKITGVRVERLTDISEEDAKAEGVETELWKPTGETGWRDYNVPGGFDREACMLKTAKWSFQSLWESIHGPDSWKPIWVWVIEFKRVRT